jgi:hypothetical protein
MAKLLELTHVNLAVSLTRPEVSRRSLMPITPKHSLRLASSMPVARCRFRAAVGITFELRSC